MENKGKLEGVRKRKNFRPHIIAKSVYKYENAIKQAELCQKVLVDFLEGRLKRDEATSALGIPENYFVNASYKPQYFPTTVMGLSRKDVKTIIEASRTPLDLLVADIYELKSVVVGDWGNKWEPLFLEILSHLDKPFYREVLKAYYGYYEGEGGQTLTLKEVGELANITSERVRQILNASLRDLRRDAVKALLLSETGILADGFLYEEFSWENVDNSPRAFRAKQTRVTLEAENIRLRERINELEALMETHGYDVNLEVPELGSRDRSLRYMNLTSTNPEALGISARAYNSLRRSGKVNTLNDLRNFTSEELAEFKGMGRKSLDELVDVLEDYGIYLKRRVKSLV